MVECIAAISVPSLAQGVIEPRWRTGVMPCPHRVTTPQDEEEVKFYLPLSFLHLQMRPPSVADNGSARPLLPHHPYHETLDCYSLMAF